MLKSQIHGLVICSPLVPSQLAFSSSCVRDSSLALLQCCWDVSALICLPFDTWNMQTLLYSGTGDWFHGMLPQPTKTPKMYSVKRRNVSVQCCMIMFHGLFSLLKGKELKNFLSGSRKIGLSKTSVILYYRCYNEARVLTSVGFSQISSSLGLSADFMAHTSVRVIASSTRASWSASCLKGTKCLETG